MTAEKLVELAGVSKRFGDIVALDRLDLEVLPGELLAVLGPNGAGKSTAIMLMLGLRQPDSGTARLFGRSPVDLEPRRGIGVMMQQESLPSELRVSELIELFSSYYQSPMAVEEVMDMTGTKSLKDRAYGKLSGGQKRQVQFAVAICGRPKLLVLDEPTVGMDIQARTMLWATIRRLVQDGVSIVLTTHYLEEAEALADRVAVLSKGRLIALGTVGEVRSIVVRMRISCVSSLSVDRVMSWQEVIDVHREEDRLYITAHEAENVVRSLLSADAELSELEVHRAGLTEAFAKLTREVNS